MAGVKEFVIAELLHMLDDEDNLLPIPIIAGCLPGNEKHIEGLQDILNTVENMSEQMFRSHFRIAKQVYVHLLREVRPLLQEEYTGGGIPISTDKQVLLFIWYLANQSSMRELAMIFDVSKSTVHKAVHRVANSVCQLRQRFIKWPHYARQQIIAAAIERRTQLPGCVGFIDGTHIRIVNAPGGDRDYINRKGFASIQLQLCVDDLGFITDAYVGWPGSTHDARVLRNSSLFERGETGALIQVEGGYLIGDSAYPLKRWLVAPFKDFGNLSPAQRRFNRAVSSIRQTVERAIGHLKGRFRQLRHMYCVDVEDTCSLIIAACCLHNLCLLEGDDVGGYMDMDHAYRQRDVNRYPRLFRNDAAGVAKRNDLLQIFQ